VATVSAARQSTAVRADTTQYSCFVEDCERKCATPDKRRRHLIDKHMYPKNFFFNVYRDGIDGRRSLLEDGGHHHRRKSSVSTKKEFRRKSSLAGSGTSQDAGGDGKADVAVSQLGQLSSQEDGGRAPEKPDVDMDDLAGAMSALKFVPSSIRFGRGGKVGFSRR